MNKSRAGKSRPAGLMPLVVTFFLLFAYPFLGMLWHHAYPVLTTEVLIYFLIAGLAAFLMAMLVSHTRELIGSALIVLTLVMVLLLHFNLLLEGQLISILIGIALVVVGRDKTPKLLIPILVAMIIGVYLDALLDHRRNNDHSNEVAGNTDLPPVIHLLMDSFTGVDGMPATEQGTETSDRIRSLFSSGGFTLYPRAYSRYSSTVDSMSYAFNFSTGAVSPYTSNVVTGADHTFFENRYFDLLAEAGYRIRVYQNEDMDFCQQSNPSLDQCWTYTLPDLDSIREGVDSPLTKTKLLFNTLLRQSSVIDSLVQKYQLAAPWGVSVYEPGIFRKLDQDLQRRPAGVVYFAHILFPHSPFAYQSDCGLSYESTPDERFTRMDGEIETKADLLASRFSLYLEQADCATKVLETFFETLRKSDLYDRSLIIVHGDHGSQISRLPMRAGFRDQLTVSDYRDTFSILYAMKMPQGEFSEIGDALPLESLLAQSLGRIQELSGIEGSGVVTNTPVTPGRTPIVFLLGTNPMENVEVDLFAEP